MSIVRIAFCLIILLSCSHEPSEKSANITLLKQSPTQKSTTVSRTSPKKSIQKYTSFTHLQPEGWGYRILEGGKVLIDQECIPGVPGNQGFNTSEDASRVAEFVMNKMEKGIFPPTVSEEDLKKLRISWMN